MWTEMYLVIEVGTDDMRDTIHGVFSTERLAKDYVARQAEIKAESRSSNYPLASRHPSYWLGNYDIDPVPYNPLTKD